MNTWSRLYLLQKKNFGWTKKFTGKDAEVYSDWIDWGENYTYDNSHFLDI